MLNYRTEIKENTLPVEEFLTRFVDVEKFLGYCRECSSYNVSCSCPPYDFDPMDYWRTYKKVKIVGVKILFDEADVGKTADHEEWKAILKEILHKEADRLYVLLKEEEIVTEGSCLLSAGNCRLCGSKGCDRRKHKCRQPKLRRYSIESLGGNVAAVASELLGFDLQWIEEGKIPPYLTQIGGMLYK